MLLEKWLATDSKNKKEIAAMMPKRVKKRKETEGAENQDAGWEEYYDYVFPDDADNVQQSKGAKILEMAHKWKQQKAQEE